MLRKWRAWPALIGLSVTAAGSGVASADNALISWTPPATHTDGTPLTDLTGYQLLSGCVTPGQYERPTLTLGLVTSYDLGGLPSSGTCYFALQAFDSTGTSSDISNEASKFMGAPGDPSAGPVITWNASLSAPTITQNVAVATASGSTTVTKAFPSNLTNGSLIVAVAIAESGTVTATASDGSNGSYGAAQVHGIDNLGTGNGPSQTWIFTVANTATGTPTVTITFSASTNSSLKLYEITGQDASPIDATAAGTDNGSATQVLSITTATANDVIISGIAGYPSEAGVDSGYTQAFAQTAVINLYHYGEYIADSGAAGAKSISYNSTLPAASYSLAAIAIKGAAGGGGAYNAVPVIDYYLKMIARRAP